MNTKLWDIIIPEKLTKIEEETNKKYDLENTIVLIEDQAAITNPHNKKYLLATNSIGSLPGYCEGAGIITKEGTIGLAHIYSIEKFEEYYEQLIKIMKEETDEELTGLYFSTLNIKQLEKRITFFEKKIKEGKITTLKIVKSNNPIIDSYSLRIMENDTTKLRYYPPTQENLKGKRIPEYQGWNITKITE